MRSLGGLTFLPPGHDSAVPLTLSFGVALFPQETPVRADLIPLADERLFRAKSGGADDDEAERLRRHLLSSVDGYAMLDALLVAVDNKDRYTRRHSEDVLDLQRRDRPRARHPPEVQTQRRSPSPPCCTTSARSASPTRVPPQAGASERKRSLRPSRSTR